MNTSARQRLLVVAAASAIGLLLLDRIVLAPATNRWRAASTEIGTLRRNLAAGDASLASAARLREHWRGIQAAALPAEVAQAEQTLLSNLNLWGSAAGVTVSSVTPQWKRGADTSYSILQCRVDAAGSLLAVTRFLHAIETSELALRLDSVELATRDEQGRNITATLLVSGLRLHPLEGRP